MSKKKKTAMDMTTEELAKRVFPKKVRDILKAVAYEKDGNQADYNGYCISILVYLRGVIST